MIFIILKNNHFDNSKNNHFDDSKNWKNLAIKGIRCKIHFLITAHHQFLSFTRMSVICYPHKPPLSTKQVAKLKVLIISWPFLCKIDLKTFFLFLFRFRWYFPTFGFWALLCLSRRWKNMGAGHLFTFYSSSQNNDNED